jgi:hypothetical protein
MKVKSLFSYLTYNFKTSGLINLFFNFSHNLSFKLFFSKNKIKFQNICFIDIFFFNFYLTPHSTKTTCGLASYKLIIVPPSQNKCHTCQNCLSQNKCPILFITLVFPILSLKAITRWEKKYTQSSILFSIPMSTTNKKKGYYSKSHIFSLFHLHTFLKMCDLVNYDT